MTGAQIAILIISVITIVIMIIDFVIKNIKIWKNNIYIINNKEECKNDDHRI